MTELSTGLVETNNEVARFVWDTPLWLQLPHDHRNRHGEEACKIPTFPILSVFDHSQTDPIEGHPQPEEITQLLTGVDPADISDICDRVEE